MEAEAQLQQHHDDNSHRMNASDYENDMNSLPDYNDSALAEAAAYYGYGHEDRLSTHSDEIMDSFPEGPGSPLPADRLARKQRRGGHCHSGLLRAAVMACMSSPKDDEGKPSIDSSALLTSSSETSTSSPRKRLRRTDRPITDVAVQLASLSMSPLDAGSNSGPSHHEGRSTAADFQRAPPVRRVSRRKSYNSMASGASDYDDEEFFNLDD